MHLAAANAAMYMRPMPQLAGLVVTPHPIPPAAVSRLPSRANTYNCHCHHHRPRPLFQFLSPQYRNAYLCPRNASCSIADGDSFRHQPVHRPGRLRTYRVYTLCSAGVTSHLQTSPGPRPTTSSPLLSLLSLLYANPPSLLTRCRPVAIRIYIPDLKSSLSRPKTPTPPTLHPLPPFQPTRLCITNFGCFPSRRSRPLFYAHFHFETCHHG